MELTFFASSWIFSGLVSWFISIRDLRNIKSTKWTRGFAIAMLMLCLATGPAGIFVGLMTYIEDSGICGRIREWLNKPGP